jgi:hypothetical protein
VASKSTAKAESAGRKKEPAAPPAPRSPLAELGMGAAWLVGLSAVNQVVASVFATNPLATVVVQAVIVDLAIGRAGIRWDPAADSDTSIEARNAVRGVALGAGIALLVTAISLGASAALGWAKLTAHAPGASLGLGLLRAVALGVRDALLYAGLPVYFVGRARGVPRAAAVIFGALAGGAAMTLQSAATPANIALAVAVTGLSAALWLHRGSGWASVGATAGWAFFSGVVFRGALFDVAWKKGSLAPGLSAHGAPAWIAAAGFAAVAARELVRATRSAGAGGASGAS